MIKARAFFLIFILILSINTTAFAEDSVYEQLEIFDFSEADTIINKSSSGNMEVNFKDLVVKALNGELDFSLPSVANWFFRALLFEVIENSRLMQELLVIAVLSALLKSLTESFKNKSVGELGFFVSYIVMTAVLISAFNASISIVTSLVATISSIMHGTLPLMLSLLVMSGSVSGALSFQPIVAITINLITYFITTILTPLIIFAATVQIVNFLTEKEILSKLSELIKKGCDIGLKGATALFIFILSIQRISAPILNNLAMKTAKTTINAIPVVGTMLSGAMETVVSWSQAIKSATAVALILAVVLICAIPIIKLLALIVMYKFIAAVIQPICDERIVKCIDSIGTYSTLLLNAGVTVIVMFLFSVIIMLSF